MIIQSDTILIKFKFSIMQCTCRNAPTYVILNSALIKRVVDILLDTIKFVSDIKYIFEILLN